MPAGSVGHRTGPCSATKKHRRFTELAPTMRQHRTIGVCLGPAGVGKPLSARRHAHGDLADPLRQTWGPRAPSDAQVYAAWARSRTVCHTPTVGGTLRALRPDRPRMTARVESCLAQPRRRPRADTRCDSRDSINWLRVFRNPGASRTGHRRRQQQHTRAVWPEKYGGLRGTAWHKMQVITEFFGSGARAALPGHRAAFFSSFKELARCTKLATSY